jgi:hypothetical protein
MTVPKKPLASDYALIQSLLSRAKTSATYNLVRDVIWKVSFELTFKRTPSLEELETFKRETIHREKLNASSILLCAFELADRLGVKVEGKGYNAKVVHPKGMAIEPLVRPRIVEEWDLTGNEHQEARERRLMEAEDDANFEAVWGDYIDRRPDREH